MSLSFPAWKMGMLPPCQDVIWIKRRSTALGIRGKKDPEVPTPRLQRIFPSRHTSPVSDALLPNSSISCWVEEATEGPRDPRAGSDQRPLILQAQRRPEWRAGQEPPGRSCQPSQPSCSHPPPPCPVPSSWTPALPSVCKSFSRARQLFVIGQGLARKGRWEPAHERPRALRGV